MDNSGTSRRDLLKTLAAAGGAMLPASVLWAQTGSNGGWRESPPDRCAPSLRFAGGRGPLGSWTAAKAIEEMDKHGIETSVISRTSGETEEGGEKARTFARKSNEFAAKVVSDNPKRFGFFANVTYSDTEGAHERDRIRL